MSLDTQRTRHGARVCRRHDQRTHDEVGGARSARRLASTLHHLASKKNHINALKMVASGRNRCLHLFFDRLHLCVNYAPFCIYWPTYHTIAFINRVTSVTLVLIGLTGLFTEMVRQWDHHHTSYEFGVER